jgi:hypothetical protein
MTMKGIMTIEKSEDEDWVASGAEYGEICSWGYFWSYWSRNHSNLIVRKPSKDICGLCYQFHLGNRMASSTSTRNPKDLDNEESSLQSADDNNETEADENGTLMQEQEKANSTSKMQRQCENFAERRLKRQSPL